jgi:glutathione S-transferase
MKLNHHTISTTSLPVMLFAAENQLPLEMQVVDLFSGEQVQAPDAAINPSWRCWRRTCSAPTTPTCAAAT